MPARGSGKRPKTATTIGAELARFAGVSDDCIAKWRQIEDFPGGPKGPTALLDLALWMFRRDGLIRSADVEEQSRSDRIEAAELRDIEASAAIKEARAKQLVGALVDRNAAITRVSQLFAQVRARLQAIPQELASALPPDLRQDITRDFEGKIRLILTEMVAWDPPRWFINDGTITPVRMHHCHYQCTVETQTLLGIRTVVIDIDHDHDHFIRWAGPATPPRKSSSTLSKTDARR